ncbi:hypothetical protein AeMF1_011310 [Aphanomyces euteiches]|nr:hypothetical protein AeMF1_011310 [Aphanomyces euteiches]KAH9186153.1 hypothetical protein AeNC1_011873 [Aphanomyces euteiches]
MKLSAWQVAGSIVVLVAVLVHRVFLSMPSTSQYVSVPTVLPALSPALGSGVALVDSKLIPKYATDIVSIEAQRFIAPQNCSSIPSPLSSTVHVTEAMTQPKNDSVIFVMLNGENSGLFFSWSGDASCLHALGHESALALGGDADWVALGVRLYTQLGDVIEDVPDLHASNHIIHALLEFQMWMWPGIAIGHETVLDNGVKLTTNSLSPKVFDVSGFFTQEEAEAIIAQGEPHLVRSKVDQKGERGVSASRTSHTAFLPPSQLTRQLQVRATKTARLPSPSFGERTQLVRYNQGEFYKRHLDTFGAKDVIPRKKLNMTDFEIWAKWAAAKLDAMDKTLVPVRFQRGQPWHPLNKEIFPNTLLTAFASFANATNFFNARFAQAWADWLDFNLRSKATNILEELLENKGEYLPTLVRLWEDELGLPALRYTFPKEESPHGMAQWFRWVRVMKERISALGQAAPLHLQPNASLYPKFSNSFETKVLELWRHRTRNRGDTVVNAEWIAWLDENQGRRQVLSQLVDAFGQAVVLELIRVWEAAAQFDPVMHYTMPTYVPPISPQRFVTLFLYLNDVDEGGETVFPFAPAVKPTNESIFRPGMEECSQGLAVPARALHASLFYLQTPSFQIDPLSRHGGCPPVRGVKWGANQFMWNADAEEGAKVWLNT